MGHNRITLTVRGKGKKPAAELSEKALGRPEAQQDGKRMWVMLFGKRSGYLNSVGKMSSTAHA